MRLTLKKQCPKCGSTEFVRIARSSWMRMFKSSYLFECNICRSKFLLLQDSPQSLVPGLMKESSTGLTSSGSVR